MPDKKKWSSADSKKILEKEVAKIKRCPRDRENYIRGKKKKVL